jgi:hypothetical protein
VATGPLAPDEAADAITVTARNLTRAIAAGVDFFVDPVYDFAASSQALREGDIGAENAGRFILSSPNATVSINRFGGIDVRLPDGMGIRFRETGEFFSLLEPGR